jgi:hypothetical protein
MQYPYPILALAAVPLVYLLVKVLVHVGSSLLSSPVHTPGGPFLYSSEPDLDATPDKPCGFGYKNMWLAVKSNDSLKVAEVLGLRDLQPANWRTGVAASCASDSSYVFITPPVKGWVLAVGILLPGCGDSPRPSQDTSVLGALGREFDPVLYFGTHRVVDFHLWARVDKGRVSRAYAYAGDDGTFWEIGPKTEEEQALGFAFFANEPPAGQGEEYWEREDLTFPDEDDVITIAEAWSLNPLNIDDMDLPVSTGFVGHMAPEASP